MPGIGRVFPYVKPAHRGKEIPCRSVETRFTISVRSERSNVLKRLPLRLLAPPLMLAVLMLSMQVVAHFDGSAHDEAHCTCQVCHIAHAAIPQPATQTQVQIPLQVAIFAAVEQPFSTVESSNTPSIPRAPPV